MHRSASLLALLAPVCACAGASEPPPKSTDQPATVVTISAPESDQPATIVQQDTSKDVDSGLAWCTDPSPDLARASFDLSSASAIRVFAGRCVPSDRYYRACDDAGMPIYVPPCGNEDTGTRLDVITSGQVAVSLSAHAIEVLPGTGTGGTWSVGPGRAIVAKVQTRIGETLRDSVRVVATSYAPDVWQAPSEEFSDVRTYPDSKTFTFWRKAVCVDALGCTVARWEASKTGVRLAPGDKDIYTEARERLRTEMPSVTKDSGACPLPAILTASKIYAMSRLLGDPDKTALAELDKAVAHMSTSKCPVTSAGRTKAVAAIRQELVKGVKQLVSGPGPKR